MAGLTSTARRSQQVLAYTWNHPANRGRRFRSVVRATCFQIRSRLGLRTRAAIGSRGQMFANPHRTASSKVVYGNPPDWNEMLTWKRILKPGDLFVDVGSNMGSYALWAGESGAVVVAIEPSPDTAALLRENVELNDFSITVRECGLSDRPGHLKISKGLDAMNRLLLDDTAEGDSIEVDTLDNIIGDRFAAGVKIDVEGAERFVLEGARHSLEHARIGVLQLEWNEMSIELLGEDRSPIAALLTKHGYQFAYPDERGMLRDIDDVPPHSARDIFAFLPDCRPRWSGRA